MDIERALVSKIVSTGQLEDAISKGVRSDLLADDECQDLFAYVQAHQRKYKSPPSLTAVKHDKPDFEWELVQDPLDYLIDKFLILAKRRLAQEMVVELAAMTQDEEKGADLDVHFLDVARKLATLVPSTQVSRFKDIEERIKQYEKDKREGKKTGVPFGFHKLDEWTGGLQPHEFGTVSAFSGLGKSTFLMAVAFNAWMNGYTPLFISLEMEARAILRKFDAMFASLDYRKLKALDLDDDQFDKWVNKASEMHQRTCDIPVIDSIRNCTPDHIFAETVRHKPDLVIVDYIGLMRSSHANRHASIWQTITEITQDLKQNARTLHIPILAAAQTNRAGGKDGAELDNIGSSISIVQDSDIVVGLFADEEMKERKEMEIRLNKNRDGMIGKFKAVWDHDRLAYYGKDFGDMFKRDD